MIKDYIEHCYDKNINLHLEDYMLLNCTDDYIYDKSFKIYNSKGILLNCKKSFLNPNETVALAKEYDG